MLDLPCSSHAIPRAVDRSRWVLSGLPHSLGYTGAFLDRQMGSVVHTSARERDIRLEGLRHRGSEDKAAMGALAHCPPARVLQAPEDHVWYSARRALPSVKRLLREAPLPLAEARSPRDFRCYKLHADGANTTGAITPASPGASHETGPSRRPGVKRSVCAVLCSGLLHRSDDKIPHFPLVTP